MSDSQLKKPKPSAKRRNFLVILAVLGLSYGGYRIYRRYSKGQRRIRRQQPGNS